MNKLIYLRLFSKISDFQLDYHYKEVLQHAVQFPLKKKVEFINLFKQLNKIITINFSALVNIDEIKVFLVMPLVINKTGKRFCFSFMLK